MRGGSRCSSWSVWAIRGRATPATGTTSASWSSRRSPSATASGRGVAAFKASPARGRSAANASLLLLPGTYMNKSGRAVAEAAHFYKLAAGDITVFHDEIDLPPGKVRVKVGGGIAGHNGLRSITAHVGNDYRRVRIGVGHPGAKDLVHALCAQRFRQERARLGRGADRHSRRQCRPARRAARTRASRTRFISPWWRRVSGKPPRHRTPTIGPQNPNSQEGRPVAIGAYLDISAVADRVEPFNFDLKFQSSRRLSFTRSK